jgi:pimeloyl-ACP methyl ester carboxylesterase
LIWGDDDLAIPHSTAPALQERLQDAKCVVYAGIGHRPAEEAPRRVVASIREWLREFA